MKTSIIIFFIFFTLMLFSQTNKKRESSIDKLESKCIHKNNISNSETCNCINKARESWDLELNKYYILLKEKLPKEAFEILKESQKEWIIYRDKEFLFISKFYFQVKEGTMWYEVAAQKKKEIVKARTLELKEYYEMLDF
jgi:uncharacterized protein YecT (DUF1311 family)